MKKLLLTLLIFTIYVQPIYAYDVGDVALVEIPTCAIGTFDSGGYWDWDPAGYNDDPVFRNPNDTTNILYYYPPYEQWIFGIDSVSNNFVKDAPTSDDIVGTYDVSDEPSCDYGIDFAYVSYAGAPTSTPSSACGTSTLNVCYVTVTNDIPSYFDFLFVAMVIVFVLTFWPAAFVWSAISRKK